MLYPTHILYVSQLPGIGAFTFPFTFTHCDPSPFNFAFPLIFQRESFLNVLRNTKYLADDQTWARDWGLCVAQLAATLVAPLISDMALLKQLGDPMQRVLGGGEDSEGAEGSAEGSAASSSAADAGAAGAAASGAAGGEEEEGETKGDDVDWGKEGESFLHPVLQEILVLLAETEHSKAVATPERLEWLARHTATQGERGAKAAVAICRRLADHKTQSGGKGGTSGTGANAEKFPTWVNAGKAGAALLLDLVATGVMAPSNLAVFATPEGGSKYLGRHKIIVLVEFLKALPTKYV